MTQWGLDNLFNPGKRHMDDEKRRLQSTREEIGDASGGRRIDLEGGTVSISVPGRRTAPVAPDDVADDSNDSTHDDPAGVGTAAEALAPALEAEDVPAVALASDTDLEPEVVEAELVDPEGVVEEVVVEELVATDEPEPVVTATAEPEAQPEPQSAPEPAPPAAPRRRAVSASAWARRG